MILPDKIYNVLKWVLITAVPCAITYIIALGQIYKFDTVVIVETISATAAFLGGLMGFASANYYMKKNKEQ